MSGEGPAGGATNTDRPSRSGVLGNAARSSGLSFAGALTSSLAGFVLAVILGRSLGPSGSGLIFQMISVFTIAGAVAKLGLDTTAVWLLPRLASDRRQDIRRASAVLLIGALIGGLAAAGVTFAIAPLLHAGAGDRQLVDLVRLAALFLPFSSVFAVGLAMTRGLGGIRDFVLIGSIGLPVARLAAIAVATAFTASALIIGAVWLCILALAAIASFLAAENAIRRFRDTTADRIGIGPLSRRIAAYAAPRAVSSTLEQALLWLDVLIVGLIAGPAAAGIYGVVSRLIQAGSMPSTSMRIVVAPLFSRLLHQDRIAELTELYTRTAQWIVLMSAPIYVIFAVLPEPVLRIFGSGFAVGAPALMIMCLGATISASTGNVQSLLLMSGRSGWSAINKAIVLAVSLSLLFTLVPRWGVVGAAIAWTVAMTLDALLAVIQVRRATGVLLSSGAILLALVAAGVSAAVPAFAARLLFGDTIAALTVGIGAAVIVWAAALFLLRRRFALHHLLNLFRRRASAS